MATPKRRTSTAARRRELLLFCEGEVTEEAYLKHLHRQFREKVSISIYASGCVPMTLVREAKDVKKQHELDANRGKGRAYDEYWCIFDIDEHPDLKDAVDLARRHDINVAVSNPCFELWFLLHVRDQTAYLTSAEAQSLARSDFGPGKAPAADHLATLDRNYPTAVERAKKLDQKHENDGTPFPGDNPSSGMWRLTESIRSVGI